MHEGDTLQLNLNYTYLLDFIQTKGSSLLTDEEFVKCISILRENLQPDLGLPKKQITKQQPKSRPSSSIARTFQSKRPAESTPKPVKSADLILMDALSKIDSSATELPKYSFEGSVAVANIGGYVPPASITELPKFEF